MPLGWIHSFCQMYEDHFLGSPSPGESLDGLDEGEPVDPLVGRALLGACTCQVGLALPQLHDSSCLALSSP